MHLNKFRVVMYAGLCALALIILIHTQLVIPHFSPAFTLAHVEQSPKPKAIRSFTAHLDSNWYPKDPEKLHATLAQLDTQAQQLLTVRAIIVPHAGYAYSGGVAAAVYRQLDPATIQNIIILAPSHQPFAGVALPDFDLYQIPTGALPINTGLVQALAQKTIPTPTLLAGAPAANLVQPPAPKPLFTYNNTLFENEHSAEIQLPLIHYYLPNATITPLLIGDLSSYNNSAEKSAPAYFSETAIRQVAQALAPHITDSTLLIISSDFTHYGPRFNYTPFKKYSKDQEQLRIKQLDGQAVLALEHQSLSEFSAYLARTHNTICGATPLAVLLALLEQGAIKNTEMRLVAYQTSASKSATPDPNSVSYVGAVYTTKTNTLQKTAQFSEHEKVELLKTARATLTNIFDKNIPEELLYPLQTTALNAQTGAFVTLYKNGKLRGCIGRTSTQEPLYKTVIAMTRAAALEDSRFSPVTGSELADIKISISVLTKPTPIPSYKDIVLGKHGIILTQKSRSALFLPSVATDQGWDLPTTLSELSQKAGLPAKAWQDPKISYQVFESIDFSE
jgi:AmmeMemoRadiSam system protein A/AmmeMemoRadiSam system protein B